jgi:streptogramin lyase
MDITKLLSKPGSRLELYARLIMVVSVLAASAGIIWIFVSLRQDKAIAADTTFAQMTKRPWGVALDNTGHIWVAEPDCDVAPLCAPTNGTGIIAEYDAIAGNLNKLAEFTPPQPLTFNPTFLAFDKQGNVWFTDPTRGAIGKLEPETNTWREFSITERFPGAVPYDLVIDKNGTLWFTDYTNGAIGRFDTERGVVVSEKRTPSTSAAPYGMTLAPDGSVWYALKNKNAIGSFKPPLKGTPVLQEHTVPTNQQHAIVADAAGNLWFSTGSDGRVGKYNPTTGTTKLYCVAGGAKNAHISGITVDSNNENVWFNDSTNARIGVLDLAQYANDCATGSTSGIAYSQLAVNAQPDDGLTVDNSGNVYFTDLAGKQLGEITIAPSKPNPTSPYPPGPVAKTWYFPDGHFGADYSEYLTISNPDPTNQCTFTIQYILDKGQVISRQRKLYSASQTTESVNHDLNANASQPGGAVSAIVSNNDDSDCPGIVVERSSYFMMGDNSGSAVMGATRPATSFYFADVTSGSGTRSLFSILNPAGIQSANVNIDYYANGKRVGTQFMRVAGWTHGTITSSDIHLPPHTAAVVTASQPVVVEHVTYYRNTWAGSIGFINAATSLIGAENVAHRWLFTAGFSGEKTSIGPTQENLVIANLDPTANAPAHVTINLDYADGSRHPFQLTVGAHSQVIWNVNAHVGAAAGQVGVELVSTRAGVVVQRQIFYHYTLVVNDDPALHVTGVTDTLGQTDIYRSLSFAEGENNTNYHEWLNLYNPTDKMETIYVTLINGVGSVYSRSFSIEPHRHQNIDITTYMQNELGVPGNASSYRIFLTVQTLNGQRFVADRAQYFNTLGSAFALQGGTVVSGYDGQ